MKASPASHRIGNGHPAFCKSNGCALRPKEEHHNQETAQVSGRACPCARSRLKTRERQKTKMTKPGLSGQPGSAEPVPEAAPERESQKNAVGQSGFLNKQFRVAGCLPVGNDRDALERCMKINVHGCSVRRIERPVIRQMYPSYFLP